MDLEKLFGGGSSGGEDFSPSPSEPQEEQDEIIDSPEEESGEGRMIKLDPLKVGYKHEAGTCGSCIHFLQPSGCEVVSGSISVTGNCWLYEGGGTDDEENEIPDSELAEGEPGIGNGGSDFSDILAGLGNTDAA